MIFLPDGKSASLVLHCGYDLQNNLLVLCHKSSKNLIVKGNLISQLKTNVSSEEKLLLTWFAGKYKGETSYSSNLDRSKIATIGTYGMFWENILRFWDLSTQQVKQFKNNCLSPYLGEVVVSPNGEYVLTISSGRGQLWDAYGNLLNPLDVNAKSLKGEEVSMLPIFLGEKKKNSLGKSEVRILEVWQNSTADKAGLKRSN